MRGREGEGGKRGEGRRVVGRESEREREREREPLQWLKIVLISKSPKKYPRKERKEMRKRNEEKKIQSKIKKKSVHLKKYRYRII